MNALTSRALLRATLALAAAAAATAAHADHRLFPTDVLTSGEADVSLQLGTKTTKQDDAPHVKITDDTGSVAARLGVGTHTHLSFSLSRIDEEVKQDGAARASDNGTGYGIGFRHALDLEGPVSVAFNAGVQNLRIPGNTYNIYNASVSAGLKLPSSPIRPYVTFGAVLPDEDHGTTQWQLEGGAWIPVHPRVTVIPSLSYTRYDETYDTESGHEFGLGVAAVVQLAPNTHLQPSLNFAKGKRYGEEGKSTAASISVNHKF